MTIGKRAVLPLVVLVLLTALAVCPLLATADEPLDETEIHHLQFIREEEKLAFDVYTVLFEQWGLPIFENIAASEARYVTAMGRLLAYYGVEDPYIEGIGNYTSEYIAGLYADLTEWGLQSEVEAVLVGGFIEEYDILDIWIAHDETDEEHIQEIYVNLYEGSYNHLDGFVYNYEKLTGLDYGPQLMIPEDFEYVLSCTNKGPQKGHGK